MVAGVQTRVEPRKIVFGPENPQAGSWNWLGQDLMEEWSNSERFQARSFSGEFPDADVFVFIKWLPSLEQLIQLSSRTAIMFCPVDIYGSAADIDVDWRRLRLCDRVILHTPFLEKYFRGYSPTVCFDHHLKFTVPVRDSFNESGPLLWTGSWSNLPPLAEWVNRNGLDEELIVLTDLNGHQLRTSQDFGFEARHPVRIEEWSEDRHLELLSQVRAAIDIKGNDFRQRHKPAAKALDVIASGVPLAMNAESSSSRYLQGLGFEMATPEDRDRWLSEDYWQETQAFARDIAPQLSRASIAAQWEEIISQVLTKRGVA